MKGKQITFSTEKNLHYISVSHSLSLSYTHTRTRTHTTNSRSAFNSANSKISAHHWERGRKIERPSGRECLCARERELTTAKADYSLSGVWCCHCLSTWGFSPLCATRLSLSPACELLFIYRSALLWRAAWIDCSACGTRASSLWVPLQKRSRQRGNFSVRHGAAEPRVSRWESLQATPKTMGSRWKLQLFHSLLLSSKTVRDIKKKKKKKCRRASATTKGMRCFCRWSRVKRGLSADTWARRRRRTAVGTRSSSPCTRMSCSTSRTSRARGRPGFTCWRDAPASARRRQRCPPLGRKRWRNRWEVWHELSWGLPRAKAPTLFFLSDDTTSPNDIILVQPLTVMT